MKQSVNSFKEALRGFAKTAKEKEDNGLTPPVQFEKIADEIIGELIDLINKYDAEVKCDFSLVSEISFSRKDLRRIMYNLLSNALKFRSPERKPKIFMKTEKTDGYIVFKIKDNGLGIKDSDKEKLFTIYNRFHKEVEGKGSGLAIVKSIIENSGGKVEVENKEGVVSTSSVYSIDNSGGKIEVDSKEGEGSTFSVYFKYE